jgi:hypothetical protein
MLRPQNPISTPFSVIYLTKEFNGYYTIGTVILQWLQQHAAGTKYHTTDPIFGLL